MIHAGALAGRAIGVVLLISAFAKFGRSGPLALTIDAFALLPEPLTGPLAVVLPWWEFAAGGALVIGVWTRSASLFAALLFGAFSIAVGSALARGLDFNCGCFGADWPLRMSPALLLGDLLGLALALWCWHAVPTAEPSRLSTHESG